MICLACNQKCISQKSVIKQGTVYAGCENCLAKQLVQGNENAANHKREAMKRSYAQDLVQPWEKGFARRYGIDKAKEAGWTDETIRRNY